MMMKHVVQSVAERLGYHVLSTTRTGVQFWRDIDRVKPFRTFQTILDVGAHHGQSALEFVKRGPSARVFSFEPASESYERLVEATRRIRGVTCVRSAVGDMPSTMTLHLDGWSQANTLLSPRASDSQRGDETRRSEIVPVTTIDRFVEEHDITHIDLLKTDTEGYDVHVLRGARSTLEKGMVDFIYAEVSFDADDRQHTNFANLFAEATASGFQLLGLYELTHAQQPWRIEYCNALFTRL